MISIVDQVIEAIQAADVAGDFTIPNLSVKEAYSVNTPTYPLVSIEEMMSNDGLYVDGQPRIVGNRFTVECYCKATDLTGSGGGILSARASAKLLGIEIDAFLNSNYNFSQVGDSICRPATTDNTVFRYVARYTVVIDDDPSNDTTVYLYRNI